ncbi:hypothetical protein ANCDUO_22954 [Ancylostoma duodenale]|uniref:Cadherin domain-containing protein n=1 Tax=Ancylostoma duodenale TaxID=51022 RepID=A0A0C2FJQ7_9BILA|nr:hypothetical protein ANCDUO_22954 [Ancylostoma duodenale]
MKYLKRAAYVQQTKLKECKIPIIDLHGADQLVANIREDENVLNTVPDLQIVAETGPVCKYLLTSSEKDVPFDVQVIDQYTGAAVIRVKDATNLDCRKSEYNLQVVAVRCEDDGIRIKHYCALIYNDEAPPTSDRQPYAPLLTLLPCPLRAGGSAASNPRRRTAHVKRN